ncbi:MAG: DUF3035 domain-containing protein [Rhodobacteraceae bacterium]|nr:DUF3035 domain-containing protein [Paracoccaceae bacterium]
MRISASMIILVCAVALSGCAQKSLRDLRPAGTGPDEFRILPNKPLTAPTDYAALPAPTPGGANLVDPTPQADLVAALGGNAAAVVPSGNGIPSGDAALVTAASRYGVEADVRASLAQQDAEFRRKARRSGRIKLFPVDRYEQAYRKETLEPFSANQAFRDRGFGTPTSPPAIP